MELLQRLERRPVDWAAAAVAGFGAGAVLMVLDLVWALAVTDEGPWVAPRMIAAIVLGPDVLEPSGFDLGIVVLALVLHYGLGIVGGLLIAAISAPLGLDSRLDLAVLTGAAFGLALYVINFHVLVAAYPWFAEIRGWVALLINLTFGVATTTLYWQLERRSDARPTLQQAH